MHTSSVVETKELSDELVAYRVRCCDDPTTDSWHTASVLIDHSESLKAHCQQVEARHERKRLWREGIKK